MGKTAFLISRSTSQDRHERKIKKPISKNLVETLQELKVLHLFHIFQSNSRLESEEY